MAQQSEKLSLIMDQLKTMLQPDQSSPQPKSFFNFLVEGVLLVDWTFKEDYLAKFSSLDGNRNLRSSWKYCVYLIIFR